MYYLANGMWQVCCYVKSFNKVSSGKSLLAIEKNCKIDMQKLLKGCSIRVSTLVPKVRLSASCNKVVSKGLFRKLPQLMFLRKLPGADLPLNFFMQKTTTFCKRIFDYCLLIGFILLAQSDNTVFGCQLSKFAYFILVPSRC